MAEFDGYAPLLLKVECRWPKGFPTSWARIEDLFEQARPGGYVNNPNDKGGPTFAGVTLRTYRQFYGASRSVNDLKNMAYHEWRTIYKTGYWDVMRADWIDNQSIADLCVDWLVNSGTGKVRDIQRILGVAADGKVGPKTLAAINDASCPMCLHKSIKWERKDCYERIIAAKPSQEVFRIGWMARLDQFVFKND